jgi:hypothetical protein
MRRSSNMATLFKDPIYEKNGTFQKFLKETNEKEITLKYILSGIKRKYCLKDYKKFCFTDIGAGDGTLTYPVMQFLRKRLRRNAKLETYCIEPSPLISILKAKCRKGAHYISKGMEDISLPKSDFILMAHSIQYITDRKSFAQKLKKAINKNGKLLVVGTHPDSDDLKFNRELRPKVWPNRFKKIKENLFEYLEQDGFRITREYKESKINLANALKLNEKGKAVISFCYHIPFEDLLDSDIAKFRELAKKLAPEGKLTKTLQFIWVERI